MPASPDDIATLRMLLKDFSVAQLVTVTGDGQVHSRPMVAQKTEFDGDLWFFAAKKSAKMDEIKGRPAVCVTYADPVTSRYVSVSGMAEAADDRPRMAAIWQEAYARWFPGGPEDPDITLIKVRVEAAEYWTPEATGTRILNLLKAVATGQIPDPTGQNKAVEL